MGNVGLAKLEGQITEMTGHRESSWAGTWGTVGIAEYDWINGGQIGSAALDSPDSYEVGWVLNCNAVFYASGADTYANSGMKFALEDTTNNNAPDRSGPQGRL